MPRSKVGTLKPKIDQIRKTLREKKESLGAESRSLRVRLKRMQRKVRRIHAEEQKRSPKPKAETAAGE